ncbi:MAG TPA: pitrilysin family protein [Chthoniobacterales bacterium]|nr:pitrilysin family protein [Chthoniobacterales bacterium]
MKSIWLTLGALLAGVIATMAQTPAPSPAVTVQPLAIKHLTLDNGLQVYSVEDHSSPTVAVQVWYHVGSKDDPNGRSGFAHLFEHMMFKGNDHLKPETFENLTENIGGQNNAYTAPDVTVYHEVIPSNYLEPILWAEAERMSSLALNDANFASERDVVKEEYRQRVLANPYGEFFLAIEQNSFSKHPYQRPGIGNIAELDASKLAEVRAFHSTFYRPDNATLVVAGDFKPNELEAWVKKYFGAVKKPSTKIPRVTVTEPARKQDARKTIASAKAPLPAVAVTFLAPSIRSEDSYALSLADTILSGGESSRLYQSLIYEQQIATRVGFDVDLRKDLGLLNFRVILASGKSVGDAEKALDAEIQKVLKDGVTEDELNKAKNQYLTSKLRELQTANGKASAIGEAAVMYGNAQHANQELARIQAVTADQIKAALNKYIAGKKRVVVEYSPAAPKTAAAMTKHE